MVEKYYNENGELGVLVSGGFGAGWSTWNSNELAYDKRIVEKWLENVSSDEMCNFVVSLGYPVLIWAATSSWNWSLFPVALYSVFMNMTAQSPLKHSKIWI